MLEQKNLVVSFLPVENAATLDHISHIEHDKTKDPDFHAPEYFGSKEFK